MRTFGLIGYPLTHSFSKKYFLKKFKDEVITDAEYLNFPVQNINKFKEIINSDKNFAGFNVTSPYKQEIIPFLDELDNSAQKINAVNVIKVTEKNKRIYLKGYNTDIYGFQESLKKKINPEIKNALILGSGGAAKAVSYALKNMNFNYKFVSRKEKSLEKFISYNELNKDIISENLLIINATPLGIYPKINQKPDIPYYFLSEKHHLFDLIYNPSQTLFLTEGKKRGAKIQNGLEMLHLQAEKAWEIFCE